MPIRTVILDFDGTCTDVEQEAQGFLAGYQADLARVLGLTDIQPAWAAAEAQVLAEPSRFGMVIGGRMVAPAVDLYLLATAISTLMEPELGDEETERLFKENYRFTTMAFKPETRPVLEALASSVEHLCVVTNSEPAKVGAKLDALDLSQRDTIRLHGDARKFLVAEPVKHEGSDRFAALPETQQVAGWPRPIYVRRGHYFDALASIWEATRTTPAETLVVGDVFELDLVLPGALGCGVHLVPSPRTLDYERRGVEALGGTHAEDLHDLLDLV
ncbi:MAG: HAD family hydrolase [Planctomycetota bacterium]|nr:HAD family hydrolase [Planctomycetota bacterium]